MGKRTAVQTPIQIILNAARYVGDTGQPQYCNVPNCAREASTVSLCRAHYYHYHKHRTTKATPDYEEVHASVQPRQGLWELKPRDRYCHIENCKRKYEARGLCRLHYRRWYKTKGNDAS